MKKHGSKLKFIQPSEQKNRPRSRLTHLILKWLVPFFCILSLFCTWFFFVDEKPSEQSKNKKESFITSIINKNPNLENKATSVTYKSFDKNNKEYKIYADEIWQHGDENIDMKNINGHASLHDGSTIKFQSESGVYSGKSKKVMLLGNVKLTTNTGYEIETASFEYDLFNNKGFSKSPVKGRLHRGNKFSAKGFVIANKGDIIQFIGSSQVEFNE